MEVVRLWTSAFPATSAGVGVQIRVGAYIQSLEFVAEMRILAEMKIENRENIYFLWEKIYKHTFFSMKVNCKIKTNLPLCNVKSNCNFVFHNGERKEIT